MEVYEYRIVKIEKGLFLIEYKTAPYGVWHEVENKQFKTKPKAQHEFTIKGVKIMAASKKDAIKKYNHRKK